MNKQPFLLILSSSIEENFLAFFSRRKMYLSGTAWYIIFVGLFLVGCVTKVQQPLPVSRLPELSVATKWDLIASPSHPTSKLSDGTVRSGARVKVIGQDTDGTWLLVSYRDTVGWMPAFYARGGAGRIKPPLGLKPLSGSCTTYLDDLDGEDRKWTSYNEGEIVVIGSALYSPSANDDFGNATLALKNSGEEQAKAAEYMHIPMTRSRSIVLFAFMLESIEKGDIISLELDKFGNGAIALQAAFFSHDCTEEFGLSPNGYTTALPIGMIQSNIPTPLSDTASSLTPTPLPKLVDTVSDVDTPAGTRVATSAPRRTTTKRATATATASPTRLIIKSTTDAEGTLAETCSAPYNTRLENTGRALVITDGSLNIRSRSTTAQKNVVGLAKPGEVVSLLNGPKCGQNMLWWSIRTSNGVEGWVSEGTSKDFFLEPFSGSAIAQATATPFNRPTAIPTVIPRSIATTISTATPRAVPTTPPQPVGCARTPSGVFANLWQRYRSRLGCPLVNAPVSGFWAEQPFQNGHMFWSKEAQIYLVKIGGQSGTWQRFADDRSIWNESMPQQSCSRNLPGEMYQPVRGFGNIWCRYPNIESQIGWALADEIGFQNGVVLYQNFDGGIIFRDSDGMTRGLAYVMFNDNSTFMRERY